jgi:hypothetical protein
MSLLPLRVIDTFPVRKQLDFTGVFVIYLSATMSSRADCKPAAHSSAATAGSKHAFRQGAPPSVRFVCAEDLER